MTVWVGLWHGGSSYAAPYAEDAELFGSIREAIAAVRSRRDSGHWQPQTFRYVFRQASSDLTPCAHSEDSGGMYLYAFHGQHPADETIREAIEAGCPDRFVSIGPRGGIRAERV